MGITATCQKCKQTHRYDSGEIENTGTVWHPIWTVKCRSCGSTIAFDQGKIEFFDRAQISQTKDGVEIKAFTQPSGYERAEKGDIREYWAQEYVKDNYKGLGFSQIEGPFETGPDFKGIYKGQRVVVEVERTCESFVEHGHHEDPRFRDVNVLIVLSPSEPSEDINSKLPKTIIRIDIDDFVEWWHPRARAYAKTKRIQSIIKLIADEFQSRFVRDCCDKDRDMSTCPHCDLCPYFGEGTAYGASSIFQEMALKFIVLYKYPIESDDFRLTDIAPSEIDKVYKAYI